jgi:RHS repeat-associated protein
VDATGIVVWKAAYFPFGKTQILTQTITNNIRFPGQYFDAETGLHYNWNRYYDPDTGRYLTPDPIGLTGGMNLYAYVGGDPVNGIDPWGLSERDQALITIRFYDKIDEMNRSGKRLNSPILNGLSGTMIGAYNKLFNGEWDTKYLSCVEQTQELIDLFNQMQDAGMFDDNWNFDSISYSSGIHTWGVATSDNPSDPKVTFDPWKGKMDPDFNYR